LEGLGARGQLRRPVRQQGWARWRTRSGLPSTTESDVGATTVGDVEVDDECPPPLLLRTAPKYNDVGRGEGDNKAGGSGSMAASANVVAHADASSSWRCTPSASSAWRSCSVILCWRREVWQASRTWRRRRRSHRKMVWAAACCRRSLAACCHRSSAACCRCSLAMRASTRRRKFSSQRERRRAFSSSQRERRRA
jgi:hypothetical protein